MTISAWISLYPPCSGSCLVSARFLVDPIGGTDDAIELITRSTELETTMIDLADSLVAFVNAEEPSDVQDCDILAVYVEG